MSIVIAIIGFIISIPLRTSIVALQAQLVAINVADVSAKAASGVVAKARKTKLGSKVLGKSDSLETKAGKVLVSATKKATVVAITAAIASLKGLLSLFNAIVSVLQMLDVVGLIIILVIFIVLLVALSSVIMFMNNENTQQSMQLGISGGSTSIVQEVDSAESSNSLEHWQSSCEKMGMWYASHINTYQGGTGYRMNYACELLKTSDGSTAYVQDDCSAFVTACLQLAGYYDVGGTVYCTWNYEENADGGAVLKAAGFKNIGSTQDNAGKLQEGDILLRDGHMEIFHHYDDNGQMYSWSWGNVFYNNLPKCMGSATSDSNQYSIVWRIS